MPTKVRRIRLQRQAGADVLREELIELALWGPFLDLEKPITPAQWEDVRADTWAAWRAARGARECGDYPPDGAQRYDGLQGESLQMFCADLRKDRKFVAERVPLDLAALQAFRQAHPEAVAAIAGELRIYARALRTRLTDHDAIWSAHMASAAGHRTGDSAPAR